MVGSVRTVYELAVSSVMDKARDRCAGLVERAMRQELTRIHRDHCPRRTLALVDAMGYVGISVGDEDIHDLAARLGDRKPEWVGELETVLAWYCRMADDAGVSAEFILEPVR